MDEVVESLKEKITTSVSERSRVGGNFLEVGKMLYEFNAMQGPTELAQLIEDRGLKRKGRYWMSIYEEKLRLQLPDDLLIEAGWTRVMILMENGALNTTRAGAIDAIKESMKMTAKDLKDFVNQREPTRTFRADLRQSDLDKLIKMLTLCGLKYNSSGMVNAGQALMNMYVYASKAVAAERAK